jgi:cytochrome b subunit of formate dehydrogenase
VPNFADFDPHADHHDPHRNPLLHKVYLGMEILLYSVFGFFGLHAAVWFVRSLIHTLMYGRPKRLTPKQRAYIRFEPIHRVLHVIVIVSFLGLALTGLPLKYDEYGWAQKLATALGGFDSTRVWHRVCAVATLFYFSAHLAWMARKVWEMRTQRVRWRTIVFGPDSPVPNLRDVQDFLRMVRWFVGLGPKPVFERWTYWEKFDYWAVFWGVGVIGLSGLMLWFRNAFLLFLPGEALNIAKIIHSEEALLATGFIFAIHFFNTHFRPEKFPMDLSILVGLCSEEELREERPEFLARLREKRIKQMRSTGLEKERPEYLERMHEEGRLDPLRCTAPSRSGIWFIMFAGFLALLIGLSLLVGMLVAGLGG